MEKTKMDEIVKNMMEHVCDKICRFPWEIKDQEVMDETCASCPIGKFVCDILNTYNERELPVAAGWTPVTDQPPGDKTYQTYLCTLDGELCGLDESFTGMCGFENGKWDEEDSVIAWMPLPEPYKPEQDN